MKGVLLHLMNVICLTGIILIATKPSCMERPTRKCPVKGMSNQCDQIGGFLNVLGNKVPCKRRPNIYKQF